MRSKYLVLVVLIMTAILWIKGNTVQASSLERWDITKEYTSEKDSVKYFAYLSKDKKESWIYKAELLDKNKMLDVVFPKEMEGVPVTCVGVTHELRSVIAEKENWPESAAGLVYNLFNEGWEPSSWGEEHYSLTTNVRSVVLPDTVTEMGVAAFSRMYNLQSVHLSKRITYLDWYTFLDCRDLQKVDFPAKFKADVSAFSYCDKLKGLMAETKYLKGATLIYEGNMVINSSDKTLIQVMPQATKITIPTNIKWIQPKAFTNSCLKKVKVAKKNKFFAVARRCLYDKRDKALILIFGKGNTVTLSKKIKEIGQDVATTKYKIKKLVIPKKIKRVDKWKKPYITNNKKVKIYYCGKRIR